MTEQINPNDDTQEEVTQDEAEQAKAVDLKALGIEPLSTPIPVITKLYRTFVSKVQKYNKARQAQKEDPADPVVIINARIATSLKNEKNNDVLAEMISSSEALVSNIADALFSQLEKNNGLLQSYVVLNGMKSLLSDVQENFDYYFAKAVQQEKDQSGIQVTPSEEVMVDKLTAIKLRSLLENRINIMEAMGEEVSGFYKVSDAGRKSFDTDQIPRLPKLDLGDAAPKSFSSLHLTFRWSPRLEDGSFDVARYTQEEGITLNDVAHDIVSSGSYRMSGAGIAEMLKKAGHGIGATDEEWELEFPTGKLFGRKSG